MFRDALGQLENWKSRKNRKPLVIRGARQTGKTWLMKEFGRSYVSCAYINFQDNPRMKALFKGGFSIENLITGLQLEADCVIDAENTLLLFDEVQEVPEALTSLKYFCENAPEYHIVAAGSMLGVAMHPDTSFPVGKVEFLDLFPMSFMEFLPAIGNGDLTDLLRSGDFDLITVFASRLTELLRVYLLVGGMPEAILAYREKRDFSRVRSVQQALLDGYEQDFSKHAPPSIIPRIRAVWNSLPAQLARENRRFIWGVAREGARAREYEIAIQWLLDCGLAVRVCRVTRPGIPLSAYRNGGAFKLYCMDTGLLGAMAEVDPAAVLEGNRLFAEFKGALTEQYILQQLISSGISPWYWSAARGNAEIDFLVQLRGEVIPLEVKAAENLQAKSLRAYRERFTPALSVRSSLSNYREEEWLVNLPLYAISYLPDLITSLKR